MRSGRLRHVVTIEHYTESQDLNTGEVTNDWATFATVRAGVEPLKGREFFASQERQSEVEVRIVIRYLEGVESTMRVLFDSRYYAIKSVINKDERNREMELMCAQGVLSG